MNINLLLGEEGNNLHALIRNILNKKGAEISLHLFLCIKLYYD